MKDLMIKNLKAESKDFKSNKPVIQETLRSKRELLTY